MSSVIIAGNTSGSITLSAPAISGSSVLTLPVATDTLVGKATTDTLTNKTLTSPTITGATITVASTAAPAFSAYATTTQSFVNVAQTKVTLAGEYFDTNNNFASSRFTPTVAGYYFITGSVTFNNNVNNIGSYTHIYKNGSSIATSSASANAGVYSGLSISTLTYLNGSTDYVELYATQASGVTKDTAYTVINTNDGVTFSGFLARSA